MPNGTDDIYFVAYQERADLEFDLPEDSEHIDIVDVLFQGLTIENAGITLAEMKILFRGFLMALLFRQVLRGGMPIFVVKGPNDSGKTSFVKKMIHYCLETSLTTKSRRCPVMHGHSAHSLTTGCFRSSIMPTLRSLAL